LAYREGGQERHEKEHGNTDDAEDALLEAEVEQVGNEPEEPDQDATLKADDDPEARLRTLAGEVAANDELWTTRGAIKRGLLVTRYGLSYFQARKVAEVARALRRP
jgi:hypothetical protein